MSTSECPTCGKILGNEHGMKIHHARSHGESIVEEESSCERCGNSFSYNPTYSDGKYCSPACFHESGHSEESKDAISEANSGREVTWKEKISESHKGKTHTEEAKEKMRGPRPSLRGENNPMSREEVRQKMVENLPDRSGGNHPNWEGGHESYYGPSWTFELKEKVRERDNRTCQDCGVEEAELPQRLDIHHKIPFRLFGVEKHEKANEIENLISLCRSCHGKR